MEAHESAEAFICVTCGSQYPVSDVPPDRCVVCEDERQFVNFAGQQWTTLAELGESHTNCLEEVETGLTMIGTRPGFAIGQHAFLVQAAAPPPPNAATRPPVTAQPGNVLWDCFSFIDDETVAAIEALGGVAAMAISHPHFYATCVEWSRALGDPPVYLHADDREWVTRPDPCIVHWEGETRKLAEGVTIVRGGGHFPGSAMLHWAAGAGGRGVVLGSDTISVGYDRKSAMWMHSFVNLIPLSPAKVQGTIDALRGYPYDRLYSAWPHRFLAENAEASVQASADRYVRAMRV